MLCSLFGVFSCCTRSSAIEADGSLLGRPERVPGCIFCDVTKEKGFDVVWQDDAYIVFNDHKPAAAHHLLVIPKNHIESVKALSKDDAGVVKEMAAIGNRMLDTLEVPQSSRRLGFHIPPFNSVNHLHLHVHALPYKSIFRAAEYPIAQGRNGRVKGYSWFAEVGQTIKILEAGKRVGVFPC